MKSLGDFKRGDTFAFYANLKDKSTGLPIDVGAEFVKSQIRSPQGKIYASLLVSKNSLVEGQYLFQASSIVTKTWPASVNGVELHIDIEFIVDGKTSSTETFNVIVKQDVTKEVV